MMIHDVNFNAFRKDVESALAEVANKYNLKLHAGNIRYGENEFTLQLKAERTDVDVQKLNFESDVEYMNAYGFDFRKEDYKTTFIVGGKKYQLTGFKPGNKYDVIAMCLQNGKSYKMVSAEVLRALGRKVA